MWSIAQISNKFWNIFERRRLIQTGLVLGFVLSLSLSLALLYTSTRNLTIMTFTEVPAKIFIPVGCKVEPLRQFWTVYIPPLFFHVGSSVID
jgi:uncharacterized BrkB/YihY/UPF0761 family membrane protein